MDTSAATLPEMIDWSPTPTKANPPDQTSPNQPTAPLTWATRLKRTFEIDMSLCPLCGGQLRVIADIPEPELITKILNHIQNRGPPRRTPHRALPHPGPNDLFAEG